MKYTLRLALKVRDLAPGLSETDAFSVSETHVAIERQPGYLIFLAAGFETVSAAEAFMPALEASVRNLASDNHIAFVPDFEKREICPTGNPVEAAKILGLPGDSRPVDGIAENGGFSIFDSGNFIYFVEKRASGAGR